MGNWEVTVPSLLPTVFEQSLRHVELEQSIGEWLDAYPQAKFDGLLQLINPNIVPLAYAQNLANLIGLQVSTFLGTDEYKIRRQLIQAVDWYKLKGLYAAVDVILYVVELNALVYDLYTDDYTNFYREEVPGRYKSPHFDLEIILNKYFTDAIVPYLISEDQFVEARRLVEDVRPANTVPHYVLRVDGVCDESGLTSYGTAYTDPQSHVSTIVTYNWTPGLYLFDVGLILDAGHYMDSGYASLLANITKFKVGVGNKGVTPTVVMTDLDDSIYTGDVLGAVDYPDRIEFECRVPEGAEMVGVSEFGLFNTALDTMYLISTSPDIYKSADSVLRFIATIWKGSVL